MAGDWIKIRTDIEQTGNFALIAKATKMSNGDLLMTLYKIACWFKTHGKYGKIYGPHTVVDAFCEMDGIASEMIKVGWLRVNGEVLCLFGFCDVSATRKSLGVKLRRRILSGSKCNACGSRKNLVIDHKIPIVQGGTCEEQNLQPLCSACNSRKGRLTMDQFLKVTAK